MYIFLRYICNFSRVKSSSFHPDFLAFKYIKLSFHFIESTQDTARFKLTRVTGTHDPFTHSAVTYVT
jgi:hypothetical protein